MRSAFMHSRATRIWRVIGPLALAGLLVACSINGPTPNKQLVEKAIALQLSLTQQQLTQQLHLDSPTSDQIERLRITKREPLVVQNLATFHLQGFYDYTIKMSSEGKVTQGQNPFDLYLQRQIEAKSWRLLRRQANDNGESAWYSYFLP
ncbi:MAG: hypothetical protein GDA56_14735 [Hormoscilla sp. GM7CHS1pb]|nr:hypothetical protein [Hormoscilla sp. GM7CHS1pb]